MSRTCPRCGHYLGSATVCAKCASSQPLVSRPRRTPPPPPPAAPQNHSTPESPASPPRHQPTPSGGSGLFSVRGTVSDGGPVNISWAWGVMPVRLLLWAATLGLLLTKGQRLIVAGVTNLTLAFLPLILVALFGFWLLQKIGLGGLPGCLGSIFGGTVSKGADIGIRGMFRPRPGWRFVVDHAKGQESVRLAADVPLHEDHLVVVHGPRFGGTRDAWLIQGISPVSFTRLGRGLVGTVVRLALLVPVCVWLLGL